MFRYDTECTVFKPLKEFLCVGAACYYDGDAQVNIGLVIIRYMRSLASIFSQLVSRTGYNEMVRAVALFAILRR